ncbi:unnamed protein product, partial [Rotaria magnacalcarata]
MDALSIKPDNDFIKAMVQVIVNWRELNNLSATEEVDCPMARCPKDDKYLTPYPGKSIEKEATQKRARELS